MSRNIAIYPGTFDPVTNGHLDIIKRAKKIFDKVIIAVAVSKDKNPMFPIDKRVEFIKESINDICGIEVESFDSLLVDFAHEKGVKTIIRGLRAVSDFEYELQMGYANNFLDREIDTIYLMPSLKYAFISSSVVRAILKHGGDPSSLLPEVVRKKIQCM
jgi:pantetheine-phosphate adenylyltransferase